MNTQILGLGEAESIVSYKELRGELLILDDKLARKIARQYIKKIVIEVIKTILFFTSYRYS